MLIPAAKTASFTPSFSDGPSFKDPIRFNVGETVCRDSFWFCDLLPAE